MAPVPLRRLVIALAVLAVLSPAAVHAEGKYAAIAISDKNGPTNWGYSVNQDSQESAEKLAIQKCNVADAKVIVGSHDGWCALAVGDDNGWGSGYGKTQEDARKAALDEAAKHTKNPHVMLAVSSEGESVEKNPVSGTGDHFAAIAFSEKSGAWGYGYGQPSRQFAEARAVLNSDPNGKDVVQVRNGWCALAVSDDGVHGWGSGASDDEAEKASLEDAGKRGKNPHVLISISSEGDVIWKK